MRTPRFASALALALALAGGCGPKTNNVKHGHGSGSAQAGPSTATIVAKARQLAAGGDYAGAEAEYRTAYQMNPDIATLTEETNMLIAANMVKPAVDNAKAYYDAHPTDASGIRNYDLALIAAGDFATALKVADELLALDDKDADAHEKKGTALAESGQVDAGIEELRTATQLDPKNVAFLIELGSALAKGNKPDEAALQLRQAVALEPDNGRALLQLGLALRDQAELDEAEHYLTEATKHSKDARPWFELGITQNKRGDDVGAEDSLAQATSIEPDNALYQYAYGEMLRINKKYDQAVDAYRKASTLKPPHPKATAKLGLALIEAGKLGEAEVSLSDAVRADPTNAFNYLNLGVAYMREKKTKLAIEAFENFLKLADKDDGDRPKATECVKALKKGKPCSLS